MPEMGDRERRDPPHMTMRLISSMEMLEDVEDKAQSASLAFSLTSTTITMTPNVSRSTLGSPGIDERTAHPPAHHATSAKFPRIKSATPALLRSIVRQKSGMALEHPFLLLIGMILKEQTKEALSTSIRAAGLGRKVPMKDEMPPPLFGFKLRQCRKDDGA
jgi:hypothetical protein